MAVNVGKDADLQMGFGGKAFSSVHDASHTTIFISEDTSVKQALARRFSMHRVVECLSLGHTMT